MTFSKISFFIVVSLITLLTGCSTLRLKNNDGGNSLEVFYPVQRILVPEKMSDPSTSSQAANTTTVYEKGDFRSDEQMANLELPGGVLDLVPASITGVWNLFVDGKFCRIATPQTKFGQGYRAGPLNCSGIVSRVNSWAVQGKKLYFYDNTGRIVVALYAFNVDRFEGRTLDNRPVVLSR
ncbi:AprI/Inh family metalloprotease inhibitor [Bartonella quintana]|uniref:Outer membrane lipoprotein n=3 Tax=Bartonella quintana TaxID=803 RepID=A0A0H3M473_BARQU|nr:AprI/Inh family metalloprotease inhibitor [Bartonella quintana]ETS13696.1 hypothetical protein Q651_00657 [Bartonella quintana BQ2-D70]ETS14866.1 hypothetical protein Q650_00254 [Bartonella quintana JK 73rel]ETS16706.1 hypothetical protein Q649_00263 [Bartonella quintana JK 73]ETS16953.1 hypothetical protein Q648_01114 [Bartonella quintana JK 12]ETS19247.1 hypothetical protein Q647_00256 [Bartonella quintana JK 7]